MFAVGWTLFWIILYGSFQAKVPFPFPFFFLSFPFLSLPFPFLRAFLKVHLNNRLKCFNLQKKVLNTHTLGHIRFIEFPQKN